LLDAEPELRRQAGDVAAMAEKAWVGQFHGGPLGSEAIPRRLAELKAELAGPNPTPLERLLADQGGACWLAAQFGEGAAALTPGCREQARYELRRVESAQRRLLAAARTLALVRTLLPKGRADVCSAPRPE